MLREHFQTAYVVGMTVGDKNSPDSRKRYAVTFKCGVKPFKADAAVDENTVFFRTDKC